MPEHQAGDHPSVSLRREGLHPRKRLGQNFLRDRRYLRSILDAADVQPGDRVLEIGAGTGVLTWALAERGAEVTAVELDDSLHGLLQREFHDHPHVRVVHDNALNLDPSSLFTEPYKLVGNIPYYITGPILRHFLEASCNPSIMVLMVQREVAERMTAQPGNLSLLGVSVQYYATPSIVTRVPAAAFYPRPKVESAIVRLIPHDVTDEKLRAAFFEVARAGFGTRRKQLVNALMNGLGVERDVAKELLARAAIVPQRRAETLSIDEWERLARVRREQG